MGHGLLVQWCSQAMEKLAQTPFDAIIVADMRMPKTDVGHNCWPSTRPVSAIIVSRGAGIGSVCI